MTALSSTLTPLRFYYRIKRQLVRTTSHNQRLTSYIIVSLMFKASERAAYLIFVRVSYSLLTVAHSRNKSVTERWASSLFVGASSMLRSLVGDSITDTIFSLHVAFQLYVFTWNLKTANQQCVSRGGGGRHYVGSKLFCLWSSLWGGMQGGRW